MDRKRRAVFLDRDGVINRDRNYLYHIDDFYFLPGAVCGLRQLQDQGYVLAVITNQSGIARGYYSQSDYDRLTAHMKAELSNLGISLAAVRHCPHLPDAVVPEYRIDCDCRKPQPGMIVDIATHLGLDLGNSILVGDKVSDVQAGRAAGVGSCFLVRSGHPLSAADERIADAVYADLAECAAALATSDRPTVGGSSI